MFLENWRGFWSAECHSIFGVFSSDLGLTKDLYISDLCFSVLEVVVLEKILGDGRRPGDGS